MPITMWSPALRCAPRSAISPERPAVPSRPLGIAAGRRAAVLLVLLAGGCSRNAHSVRLQASSPSEEIYRVSCERDIQACRDEASDVCAGRYEVLESTGAPVEP